MAVCFQKCLHHGLLATVHRCYTDYTRLGKNRSVAPDLCSERPRASLSFTRTDDPGASATPAWPRTAMRHALPESFIYLRISGAMSGLIGCPSLELPCCDLGCSCLTGRARAKESAPTSRPLDGTGLVNSSQTRCWNPLRQIQRPQRCGQDAAAISRCQT